MITSSEILEGRILVVDDQAVNVVLLERMLSGAGYLSVACTTDPTEVSRLHREQGFDLILLDLQMPGKDGFEVMEELKEIEPEGYLPVLVITAQPGHKLRALGAGAKDFVSKPFELAEVLARVHNMLEVRLVHRRLHAFNDLLEERVKERTAELHESYRESVLAMTRAVEYRDEDTGEHVHRISHFSRELAQRLGMDGSFVDRIAFASPMHDVGKLGIPDRILLKQARLTPEEWEVMKGHTTIGARILGESTSPYRGMATEIALDHHERWDGGGYPNGKKGEAIPLSARIMMLCDVYDALRSKRPYKAAIDHPRAADIISHGDDRTQPGHFDPGVLAAFERCHTSFRDIFEECSGETGIPGPASR